MTPLGNPGDGVLKIKKSTLSGNTSAGRGGGIVNHNGGTVILTNSTISGNESAAEGGGLYVYSADVNSDVVLNNATIVSNTSNSATDPYAGIYVRSFASIATVTARNSIVAEQAVGDDCGFSGVGANFITAGHNIESGTGCGFNDFANGDQQSEMPGLLALSSNNGSTETHAVPAGSVAENAGDPAGCLADLNGDGVTTGVLITDQRGEPRGLTVCDVGAYELQSYEQQ